MIIDTPDKERRFAAAWTAGASVQEIAAMFDMSRGTVGEARVRLGLPSRMEHSWTPARIEAARRMYVVEGKSSREIAEALGQGLTRNAVIGKATRAGWNVEGRRSPSNPNRVLKAATVARSHIRPPKPGPGSKPPGVFGLMSQATSTATEQQRQERAAEGQKAIARTQVVTVESPNALPFLEARRGCKWPIGEGLAMMSCCNPIHRGVYCEGHSAVAFSAIQPRERDRGDRAASSFTRYDRIAAPRPKTANDGLWDVAA